MKPETRLSYHLRRVERFTAGLCIRDRQEVKRLLVSAYEAGKRDERQKVKQC